MKILFLAANPRGTDQLQLDQEAKKIEDGLDRSRLRDQFNLVTKWAVDAESLRRAMLKEQPDIVHFSGHGAGDSGLVLVGQDGRPKPATADALSGLFDIFSDVKCVLLNACFAEVQAKAIVEHIDYVIGMKRAVRDSAAIAFATGFYDGLGYGLDIEDAFKLGCNAIQFEMVSFPYGNRSQIADEVRDIDIDHAAGDKTTIPADLNPTLLKKEKLMRTHLDSVDSSDSLAEKLRAAETINTPSAIEQYRNRVRGFLADQHLNPIEEFQLATLAKVLGISELMASQIIKEEQQVVESARESYRTVFLATIQKGYYPFTSQINKELKEMQQQLGLSDANVEDITLPIILSHEKTQRSPIPPTAHPTPISYTATPTRQSRPIRNLALGALIAALGVGTALIIFNVNGAGQLPDISSTSGNDNPPLPDESQDSTESTDTPHPMGPTPGSNEVPAVIQGASAVNLRAGKSDDAERISVLNQGEVFQTIPQERGWWPVRKADGTLGYVYSTWIKLDADDDSTPDPSPSPVQEPHPMGPTPGPNEVPAVIQGASSVNLRAGKSNDAERVGFLSQGEVFQTIPQERGWWPVRKADGTLGYVFSTWINLDTDSPTPEPSPSPVQEPHPMGPTPGPDEVSAVIQGASAVNLRAGKSNNAERVGFLSEGEVFQTIPQSETWWPVRTADGTLGYVHRRYINPN